MVPKASRLPYKEFREHGYREATTPFFSVKARRNVLGENRLGVVVRVSSVKSAVRRNFLKRQVKTVFLSIPPGKIDLLVILRSRATLLSKHTFQKELRDTINFLIPHS